MIGFFPFLSTKAFQIPASDSVDQVITFSTRSDVQIRSLSAYLSAGTAPVGHNRTINMRPVGETKWISDYAIDIASIIGSTFPYRLSSYLTVDPSKGLEVSLADSSGTACTCYVLFIGLQVIDTESA